MTTTRGKIEGKLKHLVKTREIVVVVNYRLINMKRVFEIYLSCFFIFFSCRGISDLIVI